MKTATIRDLRNHFPRVKEMVETEGEVIVTDKGEPRYKLMLYTATGSKKAHRPKNYMARLRRYQSRPMGAAAARSLHKENRGED
jgi:antitoxin (DNA-binding transcriptional repressor) of toxin-antitoxin stability system